MYLSRVEIDTNDRQKISDLTHLGSYHNWVEQSFPDEIKQGTRLRHLWRIDEFSNKKYLLLVSKNKPKLNNLEIYGVPYTAATKDYDRFLNQLVEGKKYRFRLTANPTYRITDSKSGKPRVVPHITILQQTNWLLERTKKHGFKIVRDSKEVYQLNISERDWPRLRRKGNHLIKLSRVTFDGILQITDLSKFKLALINGIGREKAYGMGLLTVIPLEK